MDRVFCFLKSDCQETSINFLYMKYLEKQKPPKKEVFEYPAVVKTIALLTTLQRIQHQQSMLYLQ
jgi:hypothetical protein